ncbi:MAG: DUF2249 domain-containing protein [Solirubrobacterales bacterium]
MRAASADESTGVLVDVLIESLVALGDVGRAEQANRLAASAYARLRRTDPGQAQRINALMHRLCRPRKKRANEEESMSKTDRELDVRNEPPARRHELIFETYEGLADGEGFVLVNDHDPKPLEYQFAAERSGGFTWDYLEQGPTVWRVRIGKPPKAVA